MKHWEQIRKTALLVLFVVSAFSAQSQVMWNLKGGYMGRNALVKESAVEEKSRPDWMIGLEMEIPLSERLNLETGLRYKDHKIYVVKEYDYNTGGDLFTRDFDANANFEIPLRLAFKQPLGKHFSLHVGAGPYISTCLGAGWERYNAEYNGSRWQDIEWKDASFSDMTQVGLETSVAVNCCFHSLTDDVCVAVHKAHDAVVILGVLVADTSALHHSELVKA